tara:strand:- start:255 stop:374 length:120 start_codon:yes stop_codon:yes gene_type:complete
VGHDMDFVKQTASKVSLLHLGKMFIEGSVDPGSFRQGGK